ncbi:unnamed protein product, partial [Pleuronectes platessa]
AGATASVAMVTALAAQCDGERERRRHDDHMIETTRLGGDGSLAGRRLCISWRELTPTEASVSHSSLRWLRRPSPRSGLLRRSAERRGCFCTTVRIWNICLRDEPPRTRSPP